MTEEFILQLPKRKEKELLARYDTMVQKAIEKALEDKELYKPMVRMSGLCRFLNGSILFMVHLFLNHLICLLLLMIGLSLQMMGVTCHNQVSLSAPHRLAEVSPLEGY